MKKFLTYIFIGWIILGSNVIPTTTNAFTVSTNPIEMITGNASEITSAVNNPGGYVARKTTEYFLGCKTIPDCLQKITAVIATLVLRVMSLILYIAAAILNFTIKYTIIDMSNNRQILNSINLVWLVFRDLANMFFMFIILYIAVGTTLKLDNISMKKMLANVIIAALFLNFSLFFTKAIIDVSNSTATVFYNQIVSKNKGDITDAIMTKLGLASLYGTNLGGSYHVSTKLEDILNNTTIPLINEEYNIIIITGILGSIFILVTSFVFIALAVMFLNRFVILIFLMMLSPLAFVSIALPHNDNTKKWSKLLIEQILFAPACILLLYATLQILGGLGIGNDLTNLHTGEVKGVLNFIVVTIFMISVLIIAKQFGAKGADGSIKIGDSMRKGIQGFVGRNTAGRFGAWADKKLADTHPGNSTIGRFARGYTTGALANAKFGSSASRIDAKKVGKEIKAKSREINNVNDLKQAIRSNDPIAANKVLDRMTREEKSRLDVKDLTHPVVAQHLSQSDIEYFVNKAEISDKDKIKISGSRLELLRTELGQRSPNERVIQNHLRKMTGKDILKLSRQELTNPLIYRHINAGQLRSMLDDIDNETRQMLYSNISSDIEAAGHSHMTDPYSSAGWRDRQTQPPQNSGAPTPLNGI